MNTTEEPERDLESSLDDKQNPTTIQHNEVVGQWDEKTGVAKGDDSDGRVNWTWKQILATISLCGVYVGSQIPLYFVGGSLTYVASDLGSASTGWLPVSNSLALAAVCPFCGYLQDMFGKRNISILGSILILVGTIVTATAHSFAQAVAGMTIAGAGASIGELTALAGTAELVPVKKRGIYLACVTFFICPFFPYVLYSQLLSAHATWRWGLWITVIYNGVFFGGVLLFYFPDSHILRKGTLSRAEIAKRIDYVGAVLSITGVILFLVALQSGGSSHPWKSAYVLCMLFIGAALIAGFVVWEWKGATYPMVPKDLFAGQRVVAIALAVAFVSGMNFCEFQERLRFRRACDYHIVGAPDWLMDTHRLDD
ncbi:putative major facilitator superfamily transporter [Cladophialophora carrionii]|uniref:Putative major facilitator superfamily transporter n=1 Tax=Cladophialophora carrionii TaxID=86049 RepID=A0A1C1C800_9EURO|nr:putative major facilitator superfamily transporter [Cladophialophora carrionii]